MSFVQSFFRDSAIYAIPAFLSRGLSIFLVPLYTRVLSPADYGALDMLMVFGSIVNLTVALEVSQGVARYYTDEKDLDKKVVYASSAFWFTLFCYTLFLCFSLLFTPTLSRLVMGKDGLETIFQLGMLYLWLNGLFYLIQNQFRWELRSRNYAVVSLIATFTTASVAVTFAYGLKWGLTGLLLGMLVGALGGCIYGLWHLRNSFRCRFQWVRLKEMLFFSAPLVPSGISVFVSHYIDRLMINHYLSLDDVGLYGIGFRLASIVGLVMIGFQGALTPLVFSHYRESDTPRQLAAIFRLFLGLALLVFMGLSVFAKEIIWLMATPAFYSAARLVVFMVPAVLLANMYIFAPGIGIAKKTHLILWINFGGAIFNTVFNWILIPRLGITGAAVATLFGNACVFTAYMVISQRLYYVPHNWRILGIAMFGTVIFAVIGIQIDFSFFFNILCNLLLLIFTLVLFYMIGFIRKEEVRKFLHIVKGILKGSTKIKGKV